MFIELLLKTLPLYLIIAIGYFGGKYLKIDNKTISQLIIYLTTPIVVFNSTFRVNLTPSVLLIIVSFFVLCTVISITALFILKFIFPDARRNILALSAAWGNTGYFGLPLAIAVLGPEAEIIVILSVLGMQIFFATIGMYITALGHFTPRDSIKKILTMPLLYTAILGFTLNYFGLFKELLNNDSYQGFIANFRGGYSLMGVMLIGLGISKIKQFKLDLKFLSFGFLAKFLVWPVLISILIYLDKNYFGLMNYYLVDGIPRPDLVYQTFLILSLVPMGANVVAMSLEFNISPEKTAFTIFLSYIFAIFYIPLALTLLMGWFF